jgi:hypothetical protein
VSLYDYEVSRRISATDPPFYALIMAAIRKADTVNTALLRAAFPDVYAEFQARYNAPGGQLDTDPTNLGAPGVDPDATETEGQPASTAGAPGAPKHTPFPPGARVQCVATRRAGTVTRVGGENHVIRWDDGGQSVERAALLRDAS